MNTLSGSTVVDSSLVTMSDLSRAVSVEVQEGKDFNIFRPYNSEVGAPEIKGFRNITIVYREDKRTGKKAGETSYIRINDYINEQLVADNIEVLMPYLIGFLQKQEEEVIKQAHREGAEKYTPEFSKVLEHLEASNSSSRLNGEKIAAWFQAEMAESLAIALAEKLGIGEAPTQAQMEKLVKIVSVYEAKLASLASPKTAYNKEEAERLQRALEVTGASSSYIGGRFHARLESMKEKPAEELLLAL